MAGVGEVRAGRKVDTAAQCESFRAVRPNGGALFHVGEGTACHLLHGNGLDFHVLERADEPEVGINRASGESQAKRFDVLQPLELDDDVDLGPHFADIYFESDERAEDGRELRLNEVIDGIGRRGFHVRELIMRVAPHDVQESDENDAIPGDAHDLERLQLVYRPTEFKSGLLGG